MGFKKTSDTIAVSFLQTESAANTFTQDEIALQLDVLNNEIFVVLAVDIDLEAPDALAGTNTETGGSVTATSQTGVASLGNTNCIATAKDVAYGAGFTTAAKIVAQRQLTRGLIKQGLVRGALGAVSGPVGWGLLAYSAYDTANQFTKAYTGTSINQRIGNLFINRPDDSINRVALGQF